MYLRGNTARLMLTTIIWQLCLWSKQWLKHSGRHLKLSFNDFIFVIDLFALLVFLCSFFFVKIKKGCPQTIAGLPSVDILAPILGISLGFVIVVTLQGSRPVDDVASFLVHKPCILSFDNQVSDEGVHSVTTGILLTWTNQGRKIFH